MADDLFGGMFDFNGDGKTDLEEQLMAHEMLHEIAQAESKKAAALDENDDPDGIDEPDDLDSYAAYSYVPPRRYPPEPSAEPAKKVLYSRQIPEEMTLAEYRRRRGTFAAVCIILILVAAALCLIPGAFLWAALETLEPGNSASALVCGVIGIGALIVIILIICATGRAIAAELRDLQKAKEAYRRYAAKENPQTPDRGGSLSGIPKK